MYAHFNPSAIQIKNCMSHLFISKSFMLLLLLAWHARGREFESRHLHSDKRCETATCGYPLLRNYLALLKPL